jgi:hypothetical protein
MQDVQGMFDLREKFIPEFEGANHINSGKGGDVVFLGSLKVAMVHLAALARWLRGKTS